MTSALTDLAPFDPLVQHWFADRFGAATAVQVQAWPRIAAGEHVLLSAPTGSGKTLAACLWGLDQLLTGAWSAGGLRLIYVSPLKALGTDVRRNLTGPLRELRERFADVGRAVPDVQIATRSGDTHPNERARQLRRPPEILVTTPESLNLMLASQRWVGQFAGVEAVILDEIHAVAGSKRGTWTMQAVEEASHRAERDPQRIALSATVEPLTTVAGFVGGYRHRGGDRYEARPVAPVVAGDRAPPELHVLAIEEIDEEERIADPERFWRVTAPRIRELIQAKRSTLVFCNSRRLAEKLTRFINADQPERLAYAHHGSLSRELRSAIEEHLKAGEIPAVVCTNSLELGIDIGDCEQVLLVQSPRNVASCLQRLGRAGHRVGEVSRGVLFATHGMDLLEAILLREQSRAGRVEPLAPVRGPLDVLVQIIVACCCVGEQDRQQLYERLRCQWAYRDLSRAAFDLAVDCASGRHAGGALRELRPLLDQLPAQQRLRIRDRGRRVFFSNAGTIPDRGYFQLRTRSEGTLIGELDEEFVWERKVGDRFALGSRHWRIVRIGHDQVEVEPAAAADVMAPFWRNEQQDRHPQTAAALGALLAEIDLRAKDRVAQARDRHGLDEAAAEQLLDFLDRQAEQTKGLPHRHRLVIERCSEIGGSQPLAVIHASWGRGLLRPWGIAMVEAWRRRFGSELGVEAADHCLLLQLPHQPRDEELRELLFPEPFAELLQTGLEGSGFFGARFRECAGRALLLPRRHPGKRQPLWLTRQRSKELLASVRRLSEFPVLAETWRCCLEDHADLALLRARLEEIRSGAIAVDVVRSARPSPFCADMVFYRINRLMYLDDQPLAAGRSELAPAVVATVLRDPQLQQALPAAAVTALDERLLRTTPLYAVQGADELVDLVAGLVWVDEPLWQRITSAIDLQADPDWDLQDPRLLRLRVGEQAGICHRLDVPRLQAAARAAGLACDCRDWQGRAISVPGSDDEDAEASDETSDEAVDWSRLLADYLGGRGPVARADLPAWWPAARVDEAIAGLTDQCRLIVGQLLADDEGVQLCDAVNYERALRLARRLRELHPEPLPLLRLPQLLAAWQGWFTPTGGDEDALEQALDPLLGWPAAARLWEQALLPCRWAQYQPAALDALVGDGPLAWFGTGKERVALHFHESVALYIQPDAIDRDLAALIGPLERVDFSTLQQRSARPAGELHASLWAAAWRGELGNSSMAALRQAVATRFKPPAPSARARTRGGFGSWRANRPTQGQWYRLTGEPESDQDPDEPDEIVDWDRRRELVRRLLRRYGILFRELLQHEQPGCRWRELLPVLRIMELGGELVTGAFLAGVRGLQFTSPDWWRWVEAEKPPASAWLCHAQDPVACTGLGLDLPDWPARQGGTWLLWHGQELLVVARRNGAELELRCGTDDERLPACLGSLALLVQRRVQPLDKLVVEQVDGQAVQQSPIIDLLLDGGFERHHDGVVLRRQYG